MTDESSWYPEGDWSLRSEWYEITSGQTLRQCDILLGCPVLKIAGRMQPPIPQSGTLPIQIERYDSIILTQSCDLENEKVEDILLAQVITWPRAPTTCIALPREPPCPPWYGPWRTIGVIASLGTTRP
jgi:hypothetical protein